MTVQQRRRWCRCHTLPSIAWKGELTIPAFVAAFNTQQNPEWSERTDGQVISLRIPQSEHHNKGDTATKLVPFAPVAAERTIAVVVIGVIVSKFGTERRLRIDLVMGC